MIFNCDQYTFQLQSSLGAILSAPAPLCQNKQEKAQNKQEKDPGAGCGCTSHCPENPSSPAGPRGARGDSRRSLAAEVVQHRATSRSLGMKCTIRGLFLNTEQSAGHYAWGFVFAARAHISSITCICKRSQLDRRGQRWKCCGFLNEQTFSHHQSGFLSIEILLNITSTYLACKLIYRSWNEGTAEHLLWPAPWHRPWDLQTHPCLSRAIQAHNHQNFNWQRIQYNF